MRASKTGVRRVGSRNSGIDETHISGAEGLYESSEVEKIVKDYVRRAMEHPKGKPDKVVITVEEIKQRPVRVPLLPVSSRHCSSPGEAQKAIGELLTDLGISERAIRSGFAIVRRNPVMHGAALVLSGSALRAEPDAARGVRVSRLGIGKASRKSLFGRLARRGINTTTVREALILASKVASCRDMVAELCISDDPDYTTGYVASKELGYVRITNIKREGSLNGGRVFFIEERSDIGRIVEYLERTPVLVET